MTASSYFARLVYGPNKLYLNGGTYDVGLDFEPPTSANWNVGFRIEGETETECEQIKNRLLQFLKNYLNFQHKLYFEYAPHNATGYVPLYGQGIYRYHILSAELHITSPWNVRNEYIGGMMNLIIAPYTEGLRQRLSFAKGHIHEEKIKTSTVESRGIYVCPPVANKFLNPVFSHSTWNNGWTSAGSVTATQIKDIKNIPIGDSAVWLQSWGTAGTCNYTQSINVGDTNAYILSAYVKMASENLPGTSDIALWYGGTCAAFTSQEVGDGWYRIWNTITGVASATASGISIRNPGVSIYAGGFQLEASLTTPTPLVFGDALGCSWASTRGSSISTGGTAGLFFDLISDVIDLATGCIRMVVKWDVASTYGTDQYLFDASNATDSFACWYSQSDDKFYFNAGGGTLTTAAQSFSQDDITVLHLSWGRYGGGSAQTAIYVNGSGTISTTFISQIPYTIFNIGSKTDFSNTLRANILDLTIWRESIESSEIAADYSQIYQWVTSGNPESSGTNDDLGNPLNIIPYLWSRGGNGDNYNHCDSLHDDWQIASGIPGNLPAHTIFDIQMNFDAPSTIGLLLSNLPHTNVLDMNSTFTGTDAAINVGTAVVSFPGSGTTITVLRDLEAYNGRSCYILTALTDAGTTCQGAAVVHYNTETNAFTSDYTSLATDGTKRWFLLGPILTPDTIPDELDWLRGYGELGFKFKLKRSSGSGTVTMDQYRFIAGDLSYIPLSDTAASLITLNGDDVYTHSATKEDGLLTFYGNIIQLEPGKYNHLIGIPMTIARAVGATDNISYERSYIIPHWSFT